MSNFTPVTGLIGGLLIGLSAVVLLAGTGRIAGISNIAHGLIDAWRTHQARQVWLWRLLFVLGMIVGTWIWFTATGRTVNPRADMHPVLLVVAGLLVGYGTSLGNGCTSGHGVCGLGRLSLRSLAATGVFMATGIATVFVVRHVIGG
ncbi:MAG: YeeE/YedE family protein [Aquabacterium sp.]|uniref:YeeE/YedE family protein n=1 Tax=Aquabacterium sp. G14 TaxID=3130164 RepID=UPI0011D52703|nr:MAG: YeeE/YedE family protein [Aquabacterium sp.]